MNRTRSRPTAKATTVTTPADDGHGTAVLIEPTPTPTDPTLRPPSFGMVLAVIVTPILPILAGALGQNLLAEGSTLRAVLTVLGAPMVAPLIDVARASTSSAPGGAGIARASRV